MSHKMSVEETIGFLTEYREVTHDLHQLISNSTVENVDLERLTDLLSERDVLIERFGQSTPDLSEMGTETMLAEIRQMDTLLSSRLQFLVTATQLKITGVQEQKRGANAYNNDYAANAIFFDRKK